MNEENKTDSFIRAIEESFAGMNPKTNWPLNGGQIDSYFDADEALDMYYRLNKLKEKMSIKEIANLMPAADIMRIFLCNNAIIGLKVANKIGIDKITNGELEKYLHFLLDILKEKTKSDVFCLDGKNFLISQEGINKITKEINWNYPESSETRRSVASLIINANNLAYTLFFDIYMTGGFYIHGPYDVSEKFGGNAIMLIRDYHNLHPNEVWKEHNLPFKKIKIFTVYKNLSVKMNFTNHIITRDSIGDKLIAYKIFVDEKDICPENIPSIIDTISMKASEQSRRVNSLSSLDRARKGAEIAFYLFKELREFMGDNWCPPKEIENTIQKFGEEFIKKFDYKTTGEIPTLEHWKKIFDPRNDYF